MSIFTGINQATKFYNADSSEETRTINRRTGNIRTWSANRLNMQSLYTGRAWVARAWDEFGLREAVTPDILSTEGMSYDDFKAGLACGAYNAVGGDPRHGPFYAFTVRRGRIYRTNMSNSDSETYVEEDGWRRVIPFYVDWSPAHIAALPVRRRARVVISANSPFRGLTSNGIDFMEQYRAAAELAQVLHARVCEKVSETSVERQAAEALSTLRSDKAVLDSIEEELSSLSASTDLRELIDKLSTVGRHAELVHSLHASAQTRFSRVQALALIPPSIPWLFRRLYYAGKKLVMNGETAIVTNIADGAVQNISLSANSTILRGLSIYDVYSFAPAFAARAAAS